MIIYILLIIMVALLIYIYYPKDDEKYIPDRPTTYTPNINGELERLIRNNDMPYMNEGMPVQLSQKCMNYWTDYYSKFLHRMKNGTPIPDELRNRLLTECSCGNQCQFMDNNRYYYFDYEKKGWDTGAKSNDKGFCFASAIVRKEGNKQIQQCNDASGATIPPIRSAKWLHWNPVGHTFKRETDVDQQVYP